IRLVRAHAARARGDVRGRPRGIRPRARRLKMRFTRARLAASGLAIAALTIIALAALVLSDLQREADLHRDVIAAQQVKDRIDQLRTDLVELRADARFGALSGDPQVL